MEKIVDEAGSITRWLIEMRQGAPDAVAALWERYFQRLAVVVRAELPPTRRAAADESDVALSAFYSFFRGVQEGRFTDLRGRDQLWRVLVVIARRKAISRLRREYAQRRGGGKTQGDALLDDIAGHEPSPDFIATLLDEVHHLLELLRAEDAMMALIATRKCAGLDNREIATELSVSVRTIERKLARAQIVWDEDLERRFGGEEE